jgi:hypothetical protein
VDGEPFFPIGWFTQYQPTSVADATQYLTTMKNQGMNAALSCYYTWSGSYLTPMTRMLQGGANAGMKVMVEIRRCALQGSCPRSDIDTQVQALRNYTSLFGWFLTDEPEYNDIEVTDLQDGYARIKNLDPADHPVFALHYGAANARNFLRKTPPPYCDVLMGNIYPVRLYCIPDPVFGDVCVRIFDPDSSAENVRACAELVNQYNLDANIAQVQAFGDGDPFALPTAEEQRYMTYAPVVEGARGLFFWMHNLDYTTQFHIDHVVAPLAQEIQSLIPVLLAETTSISVSCNKHFASNPNLEIEDITYYLGGDQGTCCLIAVNNTNQWFLNAAFMFSGDELATLLPPQDVEIPVLFEDRAVTLLYNYTGDPDTRILVDVFSPYDVNVYRLCEGGPCPGAVTYLGPPDQSTPLGPSVELQWSAASGATSYDVYFGTENPPSFLTSQTVRTCILDSLEPGTTYYWRIDAGTACCKMRGDVWSFTTATWPHKASGPRPPHGEAGVYVTIPSLSWEPALFATEYDVYFGADENVLTLQATQAATVYPLASTLTPFTPYYWRIDSKNDVGVAEGDIWTFTTGSYPGDFDLDGDVDQEDFGVLQRCFSGSASPYLTACHDADLDGDGDVDSKDLAQFQNCMSGPDRPPGC